MIPDDVQVVGLEGVVEGKNGMSRAASAIRAPVVRSPCGSGPGRGLGGHEDMFPRHRIGRQPRHPFDPLNPIVSMDSRNAYLPASTCNHDRNAANRPGRKATCVVVGRFHRPAASMPSSSRTASATSSRWASSTSLVRPGSKSRTRSARRRASPASRLTTEAGYLRVATSPGLDRP